MSDLLHRRRAGGLRDPAVHDRRAGTAPKAAAAALGC